MAPKVAQEPSFLQKMKLNLLRILSTAERPVMLLVDGHKSHVTEDLIKEAVANGIVIFCLPAHSSHLLQPLDLSLFGPLKRGWVKACAAFNHVASVVVCQRNFAKIFNVAWHTSITPEIIQSGFKKSGIFPYCPNKFDYSKLATSIPRESSQSHEVPREASQSHEVPREASQSHEVHREASQSHEVHRESSQSHEVHRESSQSHEVPRESSQSHQVTSEAIQAVLDLYNLEKILTKEQREKFRRRMENGYDLEVDTLYLTWKELFVAAGGKQNSMDGCPCNGACSCSCRGFGFCDCIAISSNQATPTPKQTTVTLAPVPYTINSPNGDISIDEDLCGIMLEPKRKTSKKKRKRNTSTDPGNKCVTSNVFLKALQSESDRKEKERKEKEEKKIEREQKRTEKKQLAEEKKARKQEEKQKKIEEKKKKMEEKQKEIEGKQQKKKKKRRQQFLEEIKTRYQCGRCNREYDEDEECDWVECDYCDTWYHYLCTDLPVLDTIQEQQDYTCKTCENNGYPSHNE